MALTLFNGSYIGKKNTGIGVFSRDLALALSPEIVLLLDPLKSGRKGSIDIPSDLSPAYGLKGHLKRLYWVQKYVPSLMHKLGADLFFSPLPEAPLFSSVRSIVLAHDLLPLRYPQPNFLFAYYLLYVTTVLHQAEMILCNSEATAREINRFLKIPASKLVTIKPGFKSQNLYPMNLSREDFFLILGRHNPHKNLARVLKAFSLLKRKNYKLMFVGPSDRRYTPRLKRIAREYQISDRCIWRDWVSDEERLLLLNKCRGLVIASLWEGFGLPALEAMACGTPVMASNRGALPEVVGATSILIDPFNYESITSGMLELSDSKTLQNISRIEGPKRALTFNWKNTAEQVERLLLDM
ncbi:glycosyltransferase family 1 protein [Prochlorococcus sp. MIT 1307]|uniref:glycosyltransferase family 4 protein n=1 Tax=Prochlorococcus sp. MIT 1307 TaxID=3096219 RepID=UPI002A748A86|nr:glycosyltransferase family 1 protein [Prochlorococcus sp. MIT 1307]